MQRGGIVYIITNKNNTVLYVGVTNDIPNRIHQHKIKEDLKSFASRYNCYKLVYFEVFQFIEEAIERMATEEKRSFNQCYEPGLGGFVG